MSKNNGGFFILYTFLFLALFHWLHLSHIESGSTYQPLAYYIGLEADIRNIHSGSGLFSWESFLVLLSLTRLIRYRERTLRTHWHITQCLMPAAPRTLSNRESMLFLLFPCLPQREHWLWLMVSPQSKHDLQKARNELIRYTFVKFLTLTFPRIITFFVCATTCWPWNFNFARSPGNPSSTSWFSVRLIYVIFMMSAAVSRVLLAFGNSSAHCQAQLEVFAT